MPSQFRHVFFPMYQEKKTLSHVSGPAYKGFQHNKSCLTPASEEHNMNAHVPLPKKQLDIWMENRDPKLSPNNYYFLISKVWVDSWIEQIEHCDSDYARIKKINNSDLLDYDNSLKTGLEPQINFFYVTQGFWLKLVSWFGGGPEIKRPCYCVDYEVALDLHNASIVKLPVLFGSNTMNILFCRYFTIEAIYAQIQLELILDASCEFSLVYSDHEHENHQFDPKSLLDKYLAAIKNLLVIIPRSEKMADATQTQLKQFESNALQSGRRGLNNIGNTCFMNSALQCLSAVVPLTDFLLSGRYEDELNLDNPLGHGGDFVRAYASLLHQLWGTGSVVGNTHLLKKTIEKSCHRFAGYYQHDAQEFLAFLLDGLHEDLNRVKKKPYIENVEDADLSDSEASKRAWIGYKMRNDSIIVDWFQGLLKSRLICSVCSKVSITFDPFMYMTLPLVKEFVRVLTFVFIPLEGAFVRCKVKCSLSCHLRDSIARMLVILEIPNRDLNRYCVYENVHNYCSLIEYETHNSLLSEYYEYYVYEIENDYTALPSLEIYQAVSEDDCRTYKECQVGQTGAATQDSISPPICAPSDSSQLRNTQPTNNDKPFPKNSVSHHFVYFRTDSGLWGIPLLLSIRSNFSYKQVYEIMKNTLNKMLGTQYKSFSCSTAETESYGIGNAAPEQETEMFKGDFSIVLGTMNGEFKQLLDIDNNEPLKINSNEILILYWDNKQSKSLRNVNFKLFILNHKSVNETSFAPKQLSLEDCIELFTGPEHLTDSNMWYCSACCKRQRAVKTLQLWSLPQILCIHLKRFNGVTRKLDTEVFYPLDNLDLRKYVLNDGQEISPPPIYDLFAVSNHFGTLAGGHYTAYVRHRSDQIWREYDDSSVRPVTSSRVQSSAAYLLFYRRRDTAWPPFDLNIIKQPIYKQDNKNYFLSDTSSSFSTLSQKSCANSSTNAYTAHSNNKICEHIHEFSEDLTSTSDVHKDEENEDEEI